MLARAVWRTGLPAVACFATTPIYRVWIGANF